MGLGATRSQSNALSILIPVEENIKTASIIIEVNAQKKNNL
jgi:hypothetical protein